MDLFNKILDAVQVHKQLNDNSYECFCPACNDKKHLIVTRGSDKVLINCLKCGAGFSEVVKFYNIKSDDKPTVVEDYNHVYRLPNSEIAYYKKRKKFSDGKKYFYFFYYDENGEFTKGKPFECNNLYNLELMEKADSSELLYIVEGEKCADTMNKFGLLSTTLNTGGGNSNAHLTSVDKEMLEKFHTKIIIPDNDDAGENYVKLFENTKVLRLGTIWGKMKHKQDVADYLLLGNDVKLIKNYTFFDFNSLIVDDLVNPSLYKEILSIKDRVELTRTIALCESQARNFKQLKVFNKMLKATKIESFEQTKRAGNYTNFKGQELKLNVGSWTATDKGVFKQEFNQDGESSPKIASPIPILPTKILKNIETGDEKVEISFYKNDKWQSIIVDRSKIANNSKIVDLSDKGIEVTSDNSKNLVKYLSDCIVNNLDVIPFENGISRLGWVRDEFIPYCDDISFDGAKEFGSLYDSVSCKGLLDDWVEFTGKLRENSICMRLMLATSFASPLIELVKGLPFVFHLWGGTGAGKTVALMVAMSVWGNPQMGKMTKTMNMTTNSMMSTASFLHHLPFGGDELQTIKSKWGDYDDLIMKITEGIDRGRMTYNQVNDLKTWKNAFIFTGEEPCTSISSGGGAKNRVIEIECTDTVIENGNETVNFVTENYGVAGRIFIEIVKSIDDLQEQYNTLLKSIQSTCDTTDKQAMSMAFILLADKIISEHFYNTNQLLVEQVSEYLASADSVETSERAYEMLCDFISRNYKKFENIELNVECWGSFRGEYCLINKSILVNFLNDNNFNFEALKVKWHKKNYLEKNSQLRFVHNQVINGVRTNLIKIKVNVESDDDYTFSNSKDLPFYD